MQCKLFFKLEESDVMTEDERDVVRWALNCSHWRKPQRELSLLDYKRASALEALVRCSFLLLHV